MGENDNYKKEEYKKPEYDPKEPKYMKPKPVYDHPGYPLINRRYNSYKEPEYPKTPEYKEPKPYKQKYEHKPYNDYEKPHYEKTSYKQKYQYKEPEIVYHYPDHHKKPKSGYNGKYEEKYKEPKYPTPESKEPEQEEPAEYEEPKIITKMYRDEPKYKQERRQPTYGYTGYSWVQNREDYSNLLG